MQKNTKSINMIFAVLLASSIISSLLQTALTTAIPIIMKDLGISAATAQWLTSAYSLVKGIMVPATAYLIRRFPTKQLFIAAMSIFTLGLLFAAVAKEFPLLMIGRILQAIGNGILLSLTQVVILTIFPAEKRGAKLGLYGLAIGAAPVISPTLAGIIMDLASWNTIFWICMILSVIVILLAFKVLGNVLETSKQSFDAVSMILCSLGFIGLFFGLGNLGVYSLLSIYAGLPIIIGAVSLVIFTYRQLHMEEPFLELRLFRNPEFRLGVVMSMIMYAVLMAGSTLFPIYIQSLRGFSATFSGLIVMPGSLIMAVISPFAGKLYDKFGIARLFIISGVLLVVSSLGVTFLTMNTSMVYLMMILALRLLAIGLIMMPLTTWGLSTIEAKNTAHGTALLTSLRTIAGSFSSAVFISIMMAAASDYKSLSPAASDIKGMNITFICISVMAFLQFLLSVYIARKQKRSGK